MFRPCSIRLSPAGRLAAIRTTPKSRARSKPKLHRTKAQMNTVQPRRNQKESHRRDAENAEVPSLGAHASSVPWVSNTLHAGCVRSQETAEENPWHLAKDFRLSSTDLCSSVVSFIFFGCG